MALFSVRLNPGEEVLVIIRRHWTTFFGSFFRFLVIVGVILSFYFFFPDFSSKLVALIILGVMSLAYLVYLFIVWYLVNLVITTERIIDIHQLSLTKRVVTEVSLADISQIFSFKEGIFQSLFNIGTLVIEIKAGGKLVGFNLKRPEELMNKINQLRAWNNEESIPSNRQKHPR